MKKDNATLVVNFFKVSEPSEIFETIRIRLKPCDNAYYRGNSMMRGFRVDPSPWQLVKFSRHAKGIAAGQWAMEIITSGRYEMEETKGTHRPDPADWEGQSDDMPRAFEWFWQDENCPSCGGSKCKDDSCPGGCVPDDDDGCIVDAIREAGFKSANSYTKQDCRGWEYGFWTVRTEEGECFAVSYTHGKEGKPSMDFEIELYGVGNFLNWAKHTT